MQKQNTGLILGGLVLGVGGIVGSYFLYKKSQNPLGYIGAPLYYGDWNVGQIVAYQRQQGMLLHHRQGFPQTF